MPTPNVRHSLQYTHPIFTQPSWLALFVGIKRIIKRCVVLGSCPDFIFKLHGLDAMLFADQPRVCPQCANQCLDVAGGFDLGQGLTHGGQAGG